MRRQKEPRVDYQRPEFRLAWLTDFGSSPAKILVNRGVHSSQQECGADEDLLRRRGAICALLDEGQILILRRERGGWAAYEGQLRDRFESAETVAQYARSVEIDKTLGIRWPWAVVEVERRPIHGVNFFVIRSVSRETINGPG